MSHVVLINQLQPRQGQRDKLIELLRKVAVGAHADPGCLHYSIHIAREDHTHPYG